MRAILPFLACLVLVLTTWTGMSQAAEARGVETSLIDPGVHVPGDGDEVPGDADKGYPHHHASCHEHHVATPAVDALAPNVAWAGTRPPMTYHCALTAHLSDADLRPPQA